MKPGKTVLAALLTGAALLAGCGDDDDDGDGGSTQPAQTAQTETTPPTTEALTSCLSEADLELKDEDEEFTNSKGETKTRQDMNLEDATYLGYVQWPSKAVADIYVAEDEAAAQKAEQEAGLFVKAFGFDPAKYVRRSATVVMTFDDPPPSDEEAKAVEDCAAGG